MLINIHCANCKEHIYNADTDTLRMPLEGHMFSGRPDREWPLLWTDAKGMDLVCPMCSWTFHEDSKLLVMHPQKRTLIMVTTGTMAMQLGLVHGKSPAAKSVEDFYDSHIPQSFRDEQAKKAAEAKKARAEKLKKKPLEEKQAEMKAKKKRRGNKPKKRRKKVPKKRQGHRKDSLKRVTGE